jgi:lipid-binding SYLF domain-containing protein
MYKRLFVVPLLIAGVAFSTDASSAHHEDLDRIHNSREVIQQIMQAPDKAIPQELLESAKCIAIIPGEKKVALIVGGKYGKGLATCRTSRGWSAPVFLKVSGGSVGLQIGGSSTDVVMIFRTSDGFEKLLSDKFKIGAAVTAAAGPVGRHAAASTDIGMHAEILTYSRSRGVFAGVDLSGAVVEADTRGDTALYGANTNRQQILEGKVAVPRPAQFLVRKITEYARRAS